MLRVFRLGRFKSTFLQQQLFYYFFYIFLEVDFYDKLDRFKQKRMVGYILQVEAKYREISKIKYSKKLKQSLQVT